MVMLWGSFPVINNSGGALRHRFLFPVMNRVVLWGFVPRFMYINTVKSFFNWQLTVHNQLPVVNWPSKSALSCELGTGLQNQLTAVNWELAIKINPQL